MSQSKRNKVKLLALWGYKNYKFLRLLVRILWCFLSSFCFKRFTLCFTFRFCYPNNWSEFCCFCTPVDGIDWFHEELIFKDMIFSLKYRRTKTELRKCFRLICMQNHQLIEIFLATSKRRNKAVVTSRMALIQGGTSWCAVTCIPRTSTNASKHK